jgi:hypothetical protein
MVNESPTLSVEFLLGEITVWPTTWIEEAAALAGATGPASEATTPASAIHAEERKYDFMAGPLK